VGRIVEDGLVKAGDRVSSPLPVTADDRQGTRNAAATEVTAWLRREWNTRASENARHYINDREHAASTSCCRPAATRSR